MKEKTREKMNGLVSAIRSDLGYSIVPRCVIRGSFTDKNSEEVTEKKTQNFQNYFLGCLWLRRWKRSYI